MYGIRHTQRLQALKDVLARGLVQPHPIPCAYFIPSLILFQSFPRLSSMYLTSLYSEDPILETCASSFCFGKQKYDIDLTIQMNNYFSR